MAVENAPFQLAPDYVAETDPQEPAQHALGFGLQHRPLIVTSLSVHFF